MLKKINDMLKEYYMKLNQRKIKIFKCIKQQIYTNIALDEMLLEIVQIFTYMKSKITIDS